MHLRGHGRIAAIMQSLYLQAPSLRLASVVSGGEVAGRAAGREPAPAASRATRSPTFTSDVNVVNLFATVRDKDGHIVSNLSKEDFVFQEDGRAQTIRYFSRETDLPLTLGLLVDTSRSQRTVIERAFRQLHLL